MPAARTAATPTALSVGSSSGSFGVLNGRDGCRDHGARGGGSNKVKPGNWCNAATLCYGLYDTYALQKVFIDRMVSLPLRCMCYGGGKCKDVDAFYFVCVYVKGVARGVSVPAILGKEYPSTREYLRLFRRVLGYPFNSRIPV